MMFRKNYNNIQNFCIRLVSFFFITYYPSNVHGNDVQINPMIGVKQEFTDNAFYSSKTMRHDFISTFSPGLEIRNRSEIFDLSLSALFDTYVYTDNRELNATNQTHSAKLEYDLSDKLDVSTDYTYKKDFNIDRDLETSGIFVGTIERNKHELSLSSNYSIDEGTFLGISYGYNNEKYDKGSAQSSMYSDLQSHSTTWGINRYLNSTLLGRIIAGYSRYDYENSSIDYSFVTLGIKKDINEVYSCQLDLGALNTRYSYEQKRVDFQNSRIVSEEIMSNKVGGLGSFVLSYRGELSDVDLSVSHDIQAASGRDGTAERTTCALDLKKSIDYEFTFYLSMKYFINRAKKNELAAQDINEETFRIGPWLRYKMSKDLYIDAKYRYYQMKNIEASTFERGNLIQLGILYKHNLLE